MEALRDRSRKEAGMGSKQELKAELVMSLPELTQYLEAIVEGLREGRVYLEHGGKVLGLCPGESIALELSAKQKKDREKLSLELSWERPEGAEDDGPALKISSQRGHSDG